MYPLSAQPPPPNRPSQAAVESWVVCRRTKLGRTDPSRSDAALRTEPGQIASHAAAITQPLTALVDKLDTPTASEVKSQVTSHASGIAQGAVLIAGLTSLSRMLGLVRTLVFSQSVGAGCLGTAYTTANGVPNLIYELALGGALTSAMVPVLARSAARSWTDPSEKARVAQISSALMTWAVVILLPATAIIAAAAGPIAQALIPANPNSACSRADMVNATSHMLVIFAPQILLYGLSVVLFGLLNAYRRFTGPALAPVAANVVMISSYLAFAALDKNAALARTPLAAELVLSIGTTMNIGTLVLVALPPAWRLHLRWRPTLKFPAGVIRQAGGLAMVGILEFVAIDLYGVVTIDLANGRGETGALVLSNYVQLVFTSVCSVLPLAITTSAFPVLSATDADEFDRTSAGSTRAVVLMSWLGTAAIAAVAVPAANILAKQSDQVPELIQAFLIAAPGVAGLALITQASRILFALGKLKVAAIGLCASPVLQLVLSVGHGRVRAGPAGRGRPVGGQHDRAAGGGDPDDDRRRADPGQGVHRGDRARVAGGPGGGRRRHGRRGGRRAGHAGRRQAVRRRGGRGRDDQRGAGLRRGGLPAGQGRPADGDVAAATAAHGATAAADCHPPSR